MTAVPVDSRTTVPGLTQQGLTSGFGMGPGKHLRYDRAPISFRIGWTQRVHAGSIGMSSSMKGTRDASARKKDARTISAAGLNTSPKLRTYIRSLSTSSSTRVLWCLVFGRASSLDAFSSYPSGRGYPALPCQTTGKLVAPSPRSSRTKGPLPSNTRRFYHQATNLSHDGLNPSHDPF